MTCTKMQIRSSSLHSSSRSIFRCLDAAQFQDLSSRAFQAREGMRRNQGAVGETVETEAASCSSCLNRLSMALVWLSDLLKLNSQHSLNISPGKQSATKGFAPIPFKSHRSGQVGWPSGHSIVDTELRGNRANISIRVPEQPPRIAPHAERLDIWQHCETQKETPHI